MGGLTWQGQAAVGDYQDKFYVDYQDKFYQDKFYADYQDKFYQFFYQDSFIFYQDKFYQDRFYADHQDKFYQDKFYQYKFYTVWHIEGGWADMARASSWWLPR